MSTSQIISDDPVAQFIEQGFLLVRSDVPQHQLDAIAKLIKAFPKPSVIELATPSGEPIADQLRYAIADDDIHNPGSPANKPTVTAVFDRGFMNLSLYAEYLMDFTHLANQQGTKKYVQAKEKRHKMVQSRLAPAELIGRTGVKINGDPLAIHAARQLMDSMDEIDVLVSAIGEVTNDLGFLEYLDLSTMSTGAVLTVNDYFREGASTFSSKHHTDEMKTALVWSINAGEEARVCNAGRSEQTAQQVVQMPGDILFLDNEGSLERSNPMHPFVADDSQSFGAAIRDRMGKKKKTEFMENIMSRFVQQDGIWIVPSSPVEIALPSLGLKR